MIISIKSENPKLLDLLFKNPNTDEGLYLNPLKNGVIVGNAVSAHQYDVVFQDSRRSYIPEESNAIDFQSYCNPLAILDICNQLFSHLLKEKAVFEEKEIKWLSQTQGAIDAYPCTIEISTFYINSHWVRDGVFLLTKYFDNVKVDHQVGHNFSLTINGVSTFEAFNLLCLVSVFTHITNRYGVFTFIDDNFAVKYARILTNINEVPYFVLYLFIKRAIKSDRQFELIKPQFESYLTDQNIEANLTFYGTHQARLKWITDQLEFDIPVLDIGCGELQYYKKMRRNNYYQLYVAVDKDPEVELTAESLSSKYGDEKLIFHSGLESVDESIKYNIILTEVIEHNTEEEAKKLVQNALSFSFNQLIITTPNVEFNKYYKDSLESRHDDHDFEFTRDEFQSFIQVCLNNEKKYLVEYFGIGDNLNGIQPTQGCIIKMKEAHGL